MNSPLTIPVKNALSHIVVVGNGMVGQHLVETRVVAVQTQEQLAQVGPGLDTVTLGPSKDRE